MENIFNNNFAELRFCTNIEAIFPARKSAKLTLYSLLWVTEGMIDLSVDDVLIPVNTHQIAFITPMKYVKIVENHGKVNVLQFNREFYCIRENDHEVSCNGILYFGTQGVPIIDLDDAEIHSFTRLLGVLREEFEVVDAIQEEMLRAILKKWLIKSTRILKRQHNFIGENEPKVELLRQFKILVEKNYRECHKVSDYAKLLNKSPKTIANQFKLLGQESPSMLIQQRIISEAKRYLLYSSLSIKEIAFHLGFEEAPSFSHFFKSKTKISPKHFKEMQHSP